MAEHFRDLLCGKLRPLRAIVNYLSRGRDTKQLEASPLRAIQVEERADGLVHELPVFNCDLGNGKRLYWVVLT